MPTAHEPSQPYLHHFKLLGGKHHLPRERLGLRDQRLPWLRLRWKLGLLVLSHLLLLLGWWCLRLWRWMVVQLLELLLHGLGGRRRLRWRLLGWLLGLHGLLLLLELQLSDSQLLLLLLLQLKAKNRQVPG